MDRTLFLMIIKSVLGAILFTCTPGWVNGQVHQLIVTVIDDNSKPLPGADVWLERQEMKPVAASNGVYIFKRLPAGYYRLRIAMAGHKPFSKKITITDHDISLPVILHPEIHVLKEVLIQSSAIGRRKKEEQLNLEIIKSDFIQKNLGGSLMQSLERLPGIKTIGIGSGQSKPLIRGLGFNRVVVIDRGIKHEGQQWGADHGLEIDQFAAEEVEIVKGAASFIYGSDAIAGAINIKPPAIPAANTFGGEINLAAKTNNALYGTSLNIYGRTQKWMSAGRITLQDYSDYRVPAERLYVYDYPVDLHRRYLRNTAGKESGLHFSTGYVSDIFRSVFYTSHTYSKSGFFANAHGLEPRRVDAALHDRSSRDIVMPYQQVNHFKFINRSSLRLNRHVVELEAGYQNNFRQEYNRYVNHGFMPAVYPDNMPIPANLERAFNKNVYSLNVNDRLKFNLHDLRFGMNAEIQNNTINGWSFLVPSFDQKSIGAFLYDKISVSDRILLHGAIRYDHSHIRIHRYADWFPSPLEVDGEITPVHIIRSNNIQRNFNSFTASAGINYNLEHIEIKASAGKSYRVPIAKELGANGVNYHYFSYERGNAALKPEESYQLDATAVLKKNKWRIQLSPFFNYFPNYIYLNPTAEHDYLYGAGNQVFEYTQSRVVRYGGELQVKYQAWEIVSAEVLGEYLYAEQLSGNKKGYTLPFSPPPSLLLNLTYEPVHTGPFHRTYFSIDYRITAPQNNIVPPEKKTGGYGVMHVQAGSRFNIQKQQVQLSLQLQNVFNTRYMDHTSFYRLIGLPEQGRNLVLFIKIPFSFLKNKQAI
ncbi:TonB-dependent receptor [Agriterribacter sp.]|uniref:TonB-dependent receptor n=1 Tax=Agriterribacter sp. TaxID=2821509 RepID=UPI002CD683EC|nr:TonB-dependent receptor [Agriterribacter sp.]HRP55448.1 TonB-dependent receptor [Agriterribacter sp.]